MAPTRARPRRKRGQTAIFFLMVLVILAFMVIWNFDLHKIIYVKNLTQNGGDAAALMASRWQGITLNLVGDLNLLQALALSANDRETSESITNLQARLLYVGPMIALVASQQGAKNNGIYRNPEFDQLMREHANRVRTEYTRAVGANGEMMFPEPYPNCWLEYADMLDYAAREGIAAGPDNVDYYGDVTEGHYLYMIRFYEAVAGRNWCWFYHNAPNLLEDYDNFFPCWWADLPQVPRFEPHNSEVYGLGLAKFNARMAAFVDFGTVADMSVARHLEGNLNTTGMTTRATWYVYDETRWGRWDRISLAGGPDSDPFPAVGTVKQQYDYAGADAAVRVATTVGRLTPGAHGRLTTNSLVWTAAAKPFGSLSTEDRPNEYSLVLPAYTDVRLIPVDTASGGDGGGYNLQWRQHIERHLPVYMERGPAGCTPGCHYCTQLLTWENPTFRRTGVTWLNQFSAQCNVHGGGGGGGGGGGTHHGH